MLVRDGYTPVEGIRATASTIPDGARGSIATSRRIGDIIREGCYHPAVRDRAEWITDPCQDYDTVDQATRIFLYVKGDGSTRGHVAYRKDPLTAELVRTPDVILRAIDARGQAALDCDDSVVLLGSLLAAIGIPVRARLVGFTGSDYQHIYLEAQVANGFRMPKFWMALDPTFPGAKPGETYGNPTNDYIADWSGWDLYWLRDVTRVLFWVGVGVLVGEGVRRRCT